MVVTESELREMWRDGRNQLPTFPPGTRFSPAAQDFIKDQRLEIRFADATAASAPAPQLQITNYQLPSSLPQLQITNYQLPFSLDTLHSLTMLVAAEARRYQLPALARQLDALAEDCLELPAAEQQERDPALLLAAPAGSRPEFAPGPNDHAILHWLNFLRATARQAAAQAAGLGDAKRAAALTQLSDAVDGLERQVQSGDLGWNAVF